LIFIPKPHYLQSEIIFPKSIMPGHPKILLVDLPTFPKGTIALSLFAVAGALKKRFEVKYLDVNLKDPQHILNHLQREVDSPALVGLKVSSQNFPFAKTLSTKIREALPDAKILWGGEFPTLMPDECLAYCDTVVAGQFEPVAEMLGSDLLNGGMKKVYRAPAPESIDFDWDPDFTVIHDPDDYFSFMGFPMETSRGCVQKCVFCMVHVMQKKYVLKSQGQIERELKAYKGKFLNIVDYNIGVDHQHVIRVSNAIKKAGVAGWMAEMCLESLDNDQMLEAMRDSGCRMIYCGLESIDEDALRTVNKANTNHVENYERIIRKVQSYGIQIGTGLILGLSGMNKKTLMNTYDFFHRLGIIYTKLTFLTYNPGTKVHSSMKKVGSYVTDEYEYLDGNHLSFIPAGVVADEVHRGAEWYIRNFYSFRKIIARSFNTRLTFLRRLEFILFSYCYGETYRKWLAEDIFRNEAGFRRLLMNPLRKSIKIRIAEKILIWLRRSQPA